MAPSIIILAAGKGSRMASAIPKALQKLAHKPLLLHLLDTLRLLSSPQIIVVVGHQHELVRAACSGYAVEFALQPQQHGTGDAVNCALPLVRSEQVLVLNADLPLVSLATLQQLVRASKAHPCALLTSEVVNPSGLGRIVRDSSGAIQAIVEQADASAQELAIAEINVGLYGFTTKSLRKYLQLLQTNNQQSELYLTDVVRLAVGDNLAVISVPTTTPLEAISINTFAELARLEKAYQLELSAKLQANGVQVIDPQRLDLRGDIQVASDVLLDVNVILEGRCIIESFVSIGPNCYLKNVIVKQHSQILANSVLEDAVVGEHCTIGPFARLRPGTVLSDRVKIGNFVEIKQTTIAAKTKINHLAYIGDATIGKNVNIGAGVITCNYDGANKHRTIVEDDVFVGSNTEIVAPLTIGARATIAAGTTLLQDVPANALALSKKLPMLIANWLRPVKKTGEL